MIPKETRRLLSSENFSNKYQNNENLITNLNNENISGSKKINLNKEIENEENTQEYQRNLEENTTGSFNQKFEENIIGKQNKKFEETTTGIKFLNHD